jgi:2-oxo-4-hydroxy-4-carboxy-5-ureidoimidazoline decarboxylase
LVMDSNNTGLHTEAMLMPSSPPQEAAPVLRKPLPPAPWSLSELNAMSAADFESALGSAVEHAPWVARRASAARPFDQVTALVHCMHTVIQSAPHPEQLSLLRGHPELAGVQAREGRMTAASTTEQGRLGLDRLGAADWAHMESLNRSYRERFGYPLVVALRLHADLPSVWRSAHERLAHEPDLEWGVALEQVCHVVSARLLGMVVASQADRAA